MTDKSGPIRDAIIKANQKLSTFFKTGNPAGIAALYSESGILLPPGSEPIAGRTAIREFWASVLQMGIEDFEIETIEVDAQDATAIETGRFTLYLRGGAVLDRGKYMVIWKLIHGEWMLHRDIWNSSMPPK